MPMIIIIREPLSAVVAVTGTPSHGGIVEGRAMTGPRMGRVR
jgi:hypothetical protein